MKPFDRNLNIIYGGLAKFENDVGFCYELFQLPGQENARIFRVPRLRGGVEKMNKKPPVKGLFVLLQMHAGLNQPSLTFCSFPKGSDGSRFVQHGALAYSDDERQKASKHIADYLVRGIVPKADQELVAALAQGGK